MNFKKIKKRFSGLGGALTLSVALAFLATVFAPLELFVGSQADFWFDHKQLLISGALLFLPVAAGLCLLFFLLRLCGKWPLAIGTAVGFGLLLAMYAHGNFLSGNLPPMDGTEVDWGADPTQRIISLAVFILLPVAGIVAAVFLRKLFPKIVLWGSAALSAVLLLTAGTLLMTTDFAQKEGYLGPTALGDMTYSTDQNLIVLVIDAVDANALQEVMEADDDFADTFDDFTCFTDALAGYPFTRNSLPLILTGQWFENETDFDSYVNQAFRASPLMHKLTQDNYRIGLYNDGELHFAAQNFENVFENQIYLRPFFSSRWASFKVLLKMSAIRYAPWDLKYFGYNVADYANSIRRLPTNDYGTVKKKNTEFYNALCKEDALTLVEDKCARILHIEGGHVPFRYNKNMEVIENGTYQDNLAATLTICKTFLQRLKDNGVYDNSAIVIMADHGFNPQKGSGLTGRTHPALLIKGVKETGEQMVKNDTPISYEQMAQALTKLTDKAPAAELFPKDAYPDGRRYIGYWYLSEHAMEEYRVSGRADEIDKIKTTGTKYLTEK